MWKSSFMFAAVALACVHAQDITACCNKAEDTCRNVCNKMSVVEIASNSSTFEQWIPNIYKFCAPHLIEFWICMNKTIQAEVVSGSGWWGRACCSLGRLTTCRHACTKAVNESGLIESGACRRSDEIEFFDCVQEQEEAQQCCSQTQSLTCHQECQKTLWRLGQSRVDLEARSSALQACEESPALMSCLRDLTSSIIPTDTLKYLPCCRESNQQECQPTCERVLRSTSVLQEIVEALEDDCGPPAIHNNFWQCFLKKDSPPEPKDLIPHDISKLHCCQKAATINCRRLCFDTFNTGWQTTWQKFYSECLGDPQEIRLSECLDDVDAPCSLGCAGLTYCSQLNNRPTSLFRSCTAQADLEAHLAVAEQKGNGVLMISGMELPLKNSTQCPLDIWKSVACALHVKPCTSKGHSSLLCAEECVRLVSSCVEWSRAPAALTARTLCARLTPNSADAPCVSLQNYMAHSTEPPLLSAKEVVTSPCAGSPCNSSQLCLINRNCLGGGACQRYHCVDGCPLGDSASQMVPIGSWVRVPMSSSLHKACFKICRCSHKGLTDCQPLPCVELENCQLHDREVMQGVQYYMECNMCVCVGGERVCARRVCTSGASATLPCYCPPHHLPVRARNSPYPNACLARCAGASDGELEFGAGSTCARAACGRRHACLPAHTVCLSKLQTTCPQYTCVSTVNCNSQPPMAVCDTDGKTHSNPCHFFMSGRKFGYWGVCLQGCSSVGAACGVNGVTYISECAAWAEYVSVDYSGLCLAVGPISDLMEPKCTFDRIICPKLKKTKLLRIHCSRSLLS